MQVISKPEAKYKSYVVLRYRDALTLADVLAAMEGGQIPWCMRTQRLGVKETLFLPGCSSLILWPVIWTLVGNDHGRLTSASYTFSLLLSLQNCDVTSVSQSKTIYCMAWGVVYEWWAMYQKLHYCCFGKLRWLSEHLFPGSISEGFPKGMMLKPMPEA